MAKIDFIGRIENKNPIQKKRTKKRLDTTPLKRTKKQQIVKGGSIKSMVHKISKTANRSKFSLFREASVKIIITLDKLNRYLSFDNVNKKTNRRQFHNKLLGKKIRLENYYQNKDLNDYIKLSYRVSGARTSKYENPYYLCTTYKQGSIALIKALKYIGKTFRLGPRAIFNLVTFSTKGLNSVFNEFFDKNDGFKKKYRNNANVLCYIANLITYFHNLNNYIHEFKVLYDNLRDEFKKDFVLINADKVGIRSNIKNDFEKLFNTNSTYSKIQEVDYRNVNFQSLPIVLRNLKNSLTTRYQVLDNIKVKKMSEKGKIFLITNKQFQYRTGTDEKGKTIKIPKDKKIRVNYGSYMMVLLTSNIVDKLNTLQTKLKVFYDKYTFPEIAPVVKYYIGKKSLIGEITLFKDQKTDMMGEKSFYEEVRKLSDVVDSKLDPFLNYLNTKVYDLSVKTAEGSDDSVKSNLEKYKIIIRYQKIVAYLKKMKKLFFDMVGEKVRKEFITQVFKKITEFITNNSSIEINYFGKSPEEFDINITKPSSNEPVDMVDTINKQFKLEKQLNKDLIYQGNRDEINKFFDGVIIYFNKKRAEYEGLRGNLVETTAIKSAQGQKGGSNLCYPILSKEKLNEYYQQMMVLCNRNILLKDVVKVKKGDDPKLRNSKGVGNPIGLESRYIKVNFRNYILKIMMGNIYFDEDIIHSKLPFKEDIDRALQFIPYYIQGQYFKVGEEKDKYTLNYSNFVYLSDFVSQKTKNYPKIQENCPKYKTSKYPLSFANLSLLTPLEIASLNGLDDAGNLQVIMGEKGFEILNKRLKKSYKQRMKKFFGGHMIVDIKIEIQGEGDVKEYTKRYLTSKEMDNINSIIKTLITSRGGDKKSKVKFGAGVLGIASILSMASPVLTVPFVVGVLLNNRNRRELYKYQTLEQVLSEFNNRLKKNEKLLTFYNTEIKNKGLEDAFISQVKGYFNLSRGVKFHDLYLHNNIDGYQDHKTTTEDILNNLIFLGKKDGDKKISDDILLKGRGLDEPYRFIIKEINNGGKYDKEKLKKLAKSIIVRLLERKNTKLNEVNSTQNRVNNPIYEGTETELNSVKSTPTHTVKGGGIKNILFGEPYTYKFNKMDVEVKKDLLDIIRQIEKEKKTNSSLEKFIYNIFTDTDLDMYGRDVLYAEGTIDIPNDKTYQLDKIILLLGLNRIVESLLYYLQNVDSIKQTLDETKQLLSRGTTKKHSNKIGGGDVNNSSGGGNVMMGGEILNEQIKTETNRLDKTRLGDIQSDELIGTSSTLQHLLLRKSYNGMSETGLIDGIDGVAIKMILYYRNNLLDLQQSENLIRQEFPNITKDVLRTYFHKVLTKLLVYLRCNEISYDYFHSSHYHLSKETKGKKQEQELEIAKLNNKPLEILNDTQDDLEKNAVLTAKILITEIQELSIFITNVKRGEGSKRTFKLIE